MVPVSVAEPENNSVEMHNPGQEGRCQWRKRKTSTARVIEKTPLEQNHMGRVWWKGRYLLPTKVKKDVCFLRELYAKCYTHTHISEGTWIKRNKKADSPWGAWRALSAEPATLDLGVVSWRPTLGVEKT